MLSIKPKCNDFLCIWFPGLYIRLFVQLFFKNWFEWQNYVSLLSKTTCKPIYCNVAERLKQYHCMKWEIIDGPNCTNVLLIWCTVKCCCSTFLSKIPNFSRDQDTFGWLCLARLFVHYALNTNVVRSLVPASNMRACVGWHRLCRRIAAAPQL